MLSNEFKRRFCGSLFGSCLSLYSVRPPGVLRNVDALIDEYLQVLNVYVERCCDIEESVFTFYKTAEQTVCVAIHKGQVIALSFVKPPNSDIMSLYTSSGGVTVCHHSALMARGCWLGGG